MRIPAIIKANGALIWILDEEEDYHDLYGHHYGQYDYQYAPQQHLYFEHLFSNFPMHHSPAVNQPNVQSHWASVLSSA